MKYHIMGGCTKLNTQTVRVLTAKTGRDVGVSKFPLGLQIDSHCDGPESCLPYALRTKISNQIDIR